jgi:hypothetical protein
MLTVLVLAIIVYIFSVTVYRLHINPVASFPGPKLAALTFWYEFYYDVLLQGRYSWKIQELHKQYGT